MWHQNNLDSKIPDLLEKLSGSGKPIAAICGATIALARIGLLDKHKHTSNGKDYLKNFAKEYKGEGNYVEAPAVADRDIITASGLAPTEFAYEILKLLRVYPPETCEEWLKFFNPAWS